MATKHKLPKAKGKVDQSMSGIIHQLAVLANKIEEPDRPEEPTSKSPPVIRVDTEKYKMIIQSRELVTTALISNQK